MADEDSQTPKPRSAEESAAESARAAAESEARAAAAAESVEEQAAQVAEQVKEAAEEAREAAEVSNDRGIFSSAIPGEEVVNGRRKRRRFDWSTAESWQKTRLAASFIIIVVVFGVFLAITCSQLWMDKTNENYYWDSYLNEETPEMIEAVEQYSQDATTVYTAVYLEQVRSIDIKNSQFAVTLEVGYRWEGDADFDFSDKTQVQFYKGTISNVLLEEDYHEGNTHYQRVTYDVTINKTFWTPRFPLESHQMRIYLEPVENVNDLVFVPVEDECSTNPSLGITGFYLSRFAVAQNIMTYDQPLLSPEYESYTDSNVYKTEVLTQFEVNRQGFGLYIKCVIALFGTLAWILLCLYICTFRRVDPLGMISAAFFGAVSNVMVGSNLLPDALQLGLIEYINLFGVGIIVAGTAIVISINTIRNERGNEAFAQSYGRVMLALFIVLVVVGNIALPLSAAL